MADYSELFDDVEAQSDRAAVVLCAARLDRGLEELFRKKLRDDAPNSLFEHGGALRDFAARIELAYALDWIDHDTRTDLNILRKMRNDFAHVDDQTLSLSKSPLKDRLTNLSMSKVVKRGIDDLMAERKKVRPDHQISEAVQYEIEQLTSPRGQFILAITILVDMLYEAIHGYGLDTFRSSTNNTTRILKGILRPLRDALAFPEHRETPS